MLAVKIIGGILFFISFMGGTSTGRGDARFISKKWVFKDVNPFVKSDIYYNFSIPSAVFHLNKIAFFGGGITIFFLLYLVNLIFKFTEIQKIIFLTILYCGTFLISAIVSTLVSYKKEEKYSEKIRKIVISREELETIRYWQSAGINSAEWREWTSWFNNELSPKINWDTSVYLNFTPFSVNQWEESNQNSVIDTENQ